MAFLAFALASIPPVPPFLSLAALRSVPPSTNGCRRARGARSWRILTPGEVQSSLREVQTRPSLARRSARKRFRSSSTSLFTHSLSLSFLPRRIVSQAILLRARKPRLVPRGVWGLRPQRGVGRRPTVRLATCRRASPPGPEPSPAQLCVLSPLVARFRAASRPY